MIGGTKDEGADGGTAGSTAGSGVQEPLVIASRQERKQAMHQMFDETKEVLNFRCAEIIFRILMNLQKSILNWRGKIRLMDLSGRYGIGGSPDNMTVFYEYNLGSGCAEQR